VALFGTQADDLGGAIKKFDLSTAVDEFGRVKGASQQAADRMVSNSLNEWQQAGRNIQTVIQDIKDSLNFDQWFSSIPKAIK
jgi:trimeric autotransporter adhesin